jgi:hypothetical protein
VNRNKAVLPGDEVSPQTPMFSMPAPAFLVPAHRGLQVVNPGEPGKTEFACLV